MRTIKPLRRFVRDERRVRGSVFGKQLDVLLSETVTLLASDQPLPIRFRDHALTGEWQGCRDCHLKPDLVLIYRKVGDDTLELVRVGTHSELFG
jgi:mRNA interferase YafQ